VAPNGDLLGRAAVSALPEAYRQARSLFVISDSGELGPRQTQKDWHGRGIDPDTFGDHLVGNPGVAEPQRRRVRQRQPVKRLASTQMGNHNLTLRFTAVRDASS
jgi:hypothetical protein